MTLTKRGAKLLRMGVFTAFVVDIHDLPEGIATFFASLQDSRLGLTIAVVVAIHNIPEGIAISMPVYYATGSRKRAFWYSFASGLSEPVGAGIMSYISLDELLPSARGYGESHIAMSLALATA